MSSLSANVAAALNAANETFQNARADNGAPARPPAGSWDCLVDNIEIETEGVTFLASNATQQEVPAFLVRFTYAMLGEPSPLPSDMVKGQQWIGKSFVIPTVAPSTLEGWDPKKPENPKKRAAMAVMETRRLKGHLTAILGEKATGNLAADLSAAIELVKGGPFAVRVLCEYDQDSKDKDRVYFKDKIAKRLSA